MIAKTRARVRDIGILRHNKRGDSPMEAAAACSEDESGSDLVFEIADLLFECVESGIDFAQRDANLLGTRGVACRVELGPGLEPGLLELGSDPTGRIEGVLVHRLFEREVALLGVFDPRDGGLLKLMLLFVELGPRFVDVLELFLFFLLELLLFLLEFLARVFDILGLALDLTLARRGTQEHRGGGYDKDGELVHPMSVVPCFDLSN